MLYRAKVFVDVNKIIDDISSCNLSDINHIENFEKNFSKYINSPYCCATDMGRTALRLGLEILNIKKGNEIIIPNFIWPGIVNPILECNLIPKLIDSQIEDLNISPSEIRKKINDKTKAIMVHNHNGIPCNVEEIKDIAQENNCYLIEDCAHSIGAKYKGKNVGNFGDISFFSFHHDKPISVGSGGMLSINNEDLLNNAKKVIEKYKRVTLEDDKKAIYGLLVQHFLTKKENYKKKISVMYSEKLLKKDQKLYDLIDNCIKNIENEQDIEKNILTYLKKINALPTKKPISKKILSRVLPNINHKQINKKIEPLIAEKNKSINLLMNTPRSIVGNIVLKSLDKINDIRNKNAEYYRTHLIDNKSFILPKVDSNKTPNFFRFTILNNSQYSLSQISSIAVKRGFEIGNFYWPKPIHLSYPNTNLLLINKNELQTSEYISNHIIDLPIHYYVDDEDRAEIVEILNHV